MCRAVIDAYESWAREMDSRVHQALAANPVAAHLRGGRAP